MGGRRRAVRVLLVVLAGVVPATALAQTDSFNVHWVSIVNWVRFNLSSM